MYIKDKTIWILSPEAWGSSFVSKHHYASLLAEKGNRVYFINPPSAQWQITALSAQLHIVDYSLGMYRGLNRLPGFLRNLLNRRLLKKLKAHLKETPDIIWSFDPFRFQNLKDFQAAYRIYHPVDVHQTALEQAVVDSADVVFSTAHKILERFDAEGTTPMHFINHGLAQHFVAPPPELAFEVDENRINVGYVGNLNYQYLDKDTLLQIVKRHPNIQFYFIGPFEKSNLSDAVNASFIQLLQQLPNTAVLGPKPSAELPAYLQKMDLFLMCYTGDQHPAQMANPHKILEYLSTGKPVVSHYIDEYKSKPDLVRMAEHNEALPQLFEETVKDLEVLNVPHLQAARKKYALDNTYEKQLQRIELHLQNTSANG